MLYTVHSPEYAQPLNVYGLCVVHEFIGKISSWHGDVMTEFMFSSLMIYSGLYHQAAPNPNQSTRCVKQKQIKPKQGSDDLRKSTLPKSCKKRLKKKQKSDYRMPLQKFTFPKSYCNRLFLKYNNMILSLLTLNS